MQLKSNINGQMSIVRKHTPVLLNRVLEVLDPCPGDVVIDGTADGGGHMWAILEKMKFSGTYVAVDLDKDILAETRMLVTTRLESLGLVTKGLKIFWIEGNYRDLPELLKSNGAVKADKFLLDLGFSSIQLVSGRGFSYKPEMAAEPLDMRYSTGKGITAADVVNTLREDELADIVWRYGEERFSRRVAKQIVTRRASGRILTVGELAECAKRAVPGHFRRGIKDVVSRTFQAFRIYVNGELENLESILQTMPSLMKPGGRAAIISFHSLEDRMVKNVFREMEKGNRAEIITKKPIVPDELEAAENPRSRSSKLRAVLMKK